MGWTCTLYNFSKKVNSTARPSGGTSFDCLIKHDTDFIRPTLEILADDLSGFNYMLFNGSYFYITSLISHRNDIWEVTGERDPMATFKPDILNTNSLILYAKGFTNSDRIPDQRIPISRNEAYYSNSAALSGSLFSYSLSGSYLLSVVGENDSVDTLIVPISQMTRLINSLGATMGQRIWNAIPDNPLIMDEVHQLYYTLCGMVEIGKSEASYGNYASLIRSCTWVPFSFDLSSAGSKTIYIGDYNTGSIGYYFSTNVLTANLSINIPWPVTDWKRNNCLVQVNLPLAGKVPLPTDKIINESSVYIYCALDIISGTIGYSIECGGYTHMVTGAQAGAGYGIGSSNISISNLISGITGMVGGGISTALGAASGNPLAVVGGVSSMASGIGEAITPQIQACGNMSGLAGVGLRSTLEVELLYYEPIGENAFANQYGGPVHLTRTIGNISGYVHCRGFSVECAGTAAEKERINSMLNSGAYIE